jgi:hypothetical protein
VEAFPDLTQLSDAELKGLIERKVAEERCVSDRRNVLHERLDRLRRERVVRLRDRYGDSAADE